MDNIDEIKAQYRKDLTALEQRSQAEYDRIVVALSGGAMGITFAFVGRIIGDSPPQEVWALVAAWALWVLSLTCVLWSHFASVRALRKTIEQVDNNTLDAETAGGLHDAIVRWLNPAGGIAFVVGAIFAGIFMASNLGENRMSNDEPGSAQPPSQSDTSSNLDRLEKRGQRPPVPPPEISSPKGSSGSSTSKDSK